MGKVVYVPYNCGFPCGLLPRVNLGQFVSEGTFDVSQELIRHRGNKRQWVSHLAYTIRLRQKTVLALVKAGFVKRVLQAKVSDATFYEF